MTAQTLDILVCDDDSALREALRESFRAGRATACWPSPDGRAAIDRASTQHFDVVLLDVALGPRSPDGYEVCRELRERRNAVAVIMLTALDSEADAVLGLEAGADDYVIKPFRPGRAAQPHPRRAAPRRHGRRPRAARRCASARSSSTRACARSSATAQPVDLTFSEFEILHALMAQRHRVHSRHELLRAVWGDSAYRDPRSVDVHVRHLREKLEAAPEEPRADPDRARRRVPHRRALTVRFGPAERVVAVLALVSALTLAVAAIALFSPLDHRLRDAARDSLAAAVRSETGDFTALPPSAFTPGDRRCSRPTRPLRRTGADVAVLDAGGPLLVDHRPRRATSRRRRGAPALRDGPQRELVDGEGPRPRRRGGPGAADGGRYRVAARRPLDDVQAATGVVRRAFAARGARRPARRAARRRR